MMRSTLSTRTLQKKLLFGYYKDAKGGRILLGEGHSGPTYRGWVEKVEQDLGEEATIRYEAALKVFERGTDPSECRREAQILASLNGHPNIVHFLKFGFDDHQAVIATEFIEGQTLFQFVKNGLDPSLKHQRVVQWGHALAHVLMHLQRLGIVHRDIKPTNVMISQDDDAQPKLIDFGFGRVQATSPKKALFSSISKGHFVGTYAFAAPEQIPCGKEIGSATPATSNVSHKSDIYSLGATLAFALEPECIHLEPEPGDAWAQRRPKLERIKDFPQIVGILEQMLAFDPGERPTAETLLGEFERLLRGKFAIEPPIPSVVESQSRITHDLLPSFKSISKGIEIAECLMTAGMVARYSEIESDTLDLTESNSVARMDYSRVLGIFKQLNDPTQSREHQYRLATQEEWLHGAGLTSGGGSMIDHTIFVDLNTPEMEWVETPNQFPTYKECRHVIYINSQGVPCLDQRHKDWPKGALRLVREPAAVKVPQASH